MNEFADNMTFSDPKRNDKVIFNKYTFFRIIEGCIAQYTSIDAQDARKLILKSYLIDLPKTYEDVVFITHEHEYHWSMIVAWRKLLANLRTWSQRSDPKRLRGLGTTI